MYTGQKDISAKETTDAFTYTKVRALRQAEADAKKLE